ncbi:MAG: DUF5651 domain-containing protein [Anaerovoracaceae bacterium]
MKTYLSAQERNEFLTIASVLKMMENSKMKEDKFAKDAPKFSDIADAWQSRGNLTKEEAKSLRMASTYLRKFADSILERVDQREKDIVTKKLSSFCFRIVDDYTLGKIYREMNDKVKNVTMCREKFGAIAEEIMSINCKNCTRACSQCELHEIFDDNLMPDGGYDMPNCRYAYFDSVKEPEKENELRKEAEEKVKYAEENKIESSEVAATMTPATTQIFMNRKMARAKTKKKRK